MAKRKTLVVVFSMGGNTHRVGEEVAHALGGQVDRLRDLACKGGTWGYVTSVWRAMRRRTTVIEGADHDPGDYDLVVLGTPVWAGHVTPAIRTYVRDHRDRLPAVACFVTLGGTAPDKPLAELAALTGKTPEATLFVDNKDRLEARDRGKVLAFVDQLSGEDSPASHAEVA